MCCIGSLRVFLQRSDVVDLVEAARLEPANAPVKEELGKVLDLIQKQKTKVCRFLWIRLRNLDDHYLLRR